ncbi:MAG: hypothetical protein KDD62_11760, partial [Bdellovibrionales bacterium]|nr:hypothetical protein [Bdellovibrionales bacterium]
MATPVSLRKAVDEGLLNSFTGLSRGSSSNSRALADALSGNKQNVNISNGLRLGARAFAGAVQGINAVIGYVNVASSTLDKLADITDDLIKVTEQAVDPSRGIQ